MLPTSEVHYIFNSLLPSDAGLPNSDKEAIKSQESDEWMNASAKEIANLEKRNVWTLVNRNDIQEWKKGSQDQVDLQEERKQARR